MHKRFCLMFLSSFLLIGAGTANRDGIHNFRLPENYEISKTALITTAIATEYDVDKKKVKRRGPPSAIMSISTNDRSASSPNSRQQIRVMPGTYVISVLCTGIRNQSREREITAAAGKEYLVACIGWNSRTIKIEVKER